LIGFSIGYFAINISHCFVELNISLSKVKLCLIAIDFIGWIFALLGFVSSSIKPIFSKASSIKIIISDKIVSIPIVLSPL